MTIYYVKETTEFLPFLLYYLKIVFSGILIFPKYLLNLYFELGYISQVLLVLAFVLSLCIILNGVVTLWEKIQFDDSFIKNLGKLLRLLIQIILIAYLTQIVIISPFVLYYLSVEKSYYIVFIVQMIIYTIVATLLFVKHVTVKHSPVSKTQEIEIQDNNTDDEIHTLRISKSGAGESIEELIEIYKQKEENNMREINWNLFSYEEIIEILKDRNNVLHESMVTIFGDIDSYEEDELILSYGENCAELGEGQYFLVNFKNECAHTLTSNDQKYIQTFI